MVTVKKFTLAAIFLFFSGVLYSSENVTIKAGNSKIIKIENAGTVSVSKKECVSAAVISDKEILVEGKKAGTAVVEVKTAEGTQNIVVEVKNTRSSERMIEVDVQILEITGVDGLDAGVDWPSLIGPSDSGDSGEGGNPVSPLNLVEAEAPPLLAFGKFSRGNLNILVDLLVKKNNARVLAKPKLLTANGKKAEFLAGGELPVALTDIEGKVTVEWKEYGVKLQIKPEVTGSGNIQAELKAEVSNLDYANGVKIGVGGGVMPALKTRSAQTTINVGDDETVIIAGLIQTEEAIVTSGVPVLSSIPLLGELFKHTTTENRKTELVIFVTPKISGDES